MEPVAESPEAIETQSDREYSNEHPQMMQPLDIPLDLPEQDQVRDVQVVTRDFGEGQGHFAALHNSQLSRSLMTGSFVSSSCSGGTTRYEGTFLSDPHHEVPIPSGQGVRVNPDGSTYTGQWKDGFPDGHGEWIAPPPSCESYVGEWKRGKKHGFGLQKFANGDMYEGDWAKGKFQDRGKYVYANGDEFMGIFHDGLKVNGTFYFKDGRVSNRKWQNGVLISSQEFDSRKRSYLPTLTKDKAHDPQRNAYGSDLPHFSVISPRGIKQN